MLEDVFTWVVAVSSGWFGRIGAVSTGLWIFSEMRSNPDHGFLNRRWWRVVAITMLPIASFEAWNAERERAHKAETAVHDATPKMGGTIDDGFTAAISADGKAHLYIRLTLVSQGAPTVALRYQAIIRRPSEDQKIIYKGPAIPIGDSEPLVTGDPNMSADIAKNNEIASASDLQEKTTTRIERGAVARGWLKFRHLDPRLIRPGDRLFIRFYDYLERPWEVGPGELLPLDGFECDQVDKPKCPGIMKPLR